MELTYLLENKLGGVTSLNYNLASHCPASVRQCVVHIDLEEEKMAAANIAFPVDEERFFRYSNMNNYYKVLKDLRKIIPEQKGALVLNYEPEMAMLDHHPVPQTTYQLVHDDYNFKLAQKYHHVVDVFIVHNKDIYDRLVSFLPERKAEIFYLPHGVKVPEISREPHPGRRLKLLFLGRMTSAKGIFDLPVISDILLKNNIDFEWTCIGDGPELGELRSKWNTTSYPVNFYKPATNADVMDICSKQDVFVLPTKFEGSPVSLLETMSVGLVPVITALPGSIINIVTDRIGFAVSIDSCEAFAGAIIKLYNDRGLLEQLSHNSRKLVSEKYSVIDTAARYHELFSRYENFFKTKRLKKVKMGSTLDQPYIPSRLTRLLRTVINSGRH